MTTLLTEQEAAALLHVTVKAVQAWRYRGGGPRFGKMRAQFLNGELIYTRKEAQIMTERGRTHYNTVRPHSSLGGQPPAPEIIQLAS